MGSFSKESDAMLVEDGNFQRRERFPREFLEHWDLTLFRKRHYGTTKQPPNTANNEKVNSIKKNWERKSTHIEGIVCDGKIDLEPVLKKAQLSFKSGCECSSGDFATSALECRDIPEQIHRSCKGVLASQNL
jgi:hypothetical protein